MLIAGCCCIMLWRIVRLTESSGANGVDSTSSESGSVGPDGNTSLNELWPGAADWISISGMVQSRVTLSAMHFLTGVRHN